MTTHPAGSASKWRLAKFQSHLFVALCGVAFAAFFPQSGAAQVIYNDFNTPAANPSETLTNGCTPGTDVAASGILICLNYDATPPFTDGLSFFQDTYLSSIDPGANSSTDYALQLTGDSTNQASSIWFSVAQDVVDGFHAWYAVKLTPDVSGSNCCTADGLAFVIQNAAGGQTDSLTGSSETGSGFTVLGASGGSIGYGGIDNSVALEMDTFYDVNWDPLDNGSNDDNHMALQSCGPGVANSPAHYISDNPATPTNCLVMLNGTGAIASNPPSSAAPPASASTVTLADSNPHQVVVDYNGLNDSPRNYLYVYLDPAFNPGTHAPVAGSVPLFSGPFNIANYINLKNGTAYVGFTAANGFNFEQHELMGFTFTPHGSGNINVCPVGGGGVAQPPCSSSQQITFTPTANASNANIKVVTQGASGLDFTLGGTTCGGTLTAGVSCTITVNFTPQAPGLRLGAVQISGFANSVNGLVASIPISGIGQAPEIAYNPTAPSQVILGGGFSLSQPVAVDAAGNLYFAATGQAYEKTSSGVETLPSNGEFGGARSIAVDGAGDVFIADNEHGQVFELPANGGAQTTVYPTLSSNGVPSGVAVDGQGDLFVADSFQNEVVEVAPNGGSNTVLYGPISSGASVNSVAVDAAGDVFVALTFPGSIVEIPAGCSSNSCQIPVGTGWNDPASLALDAAGNLYVADPELASGNGEILQVTPGCSSAACQYVLADGNTISGGVNAFSLALDGQGNVYYVNVGSNEQGVGSGVAQLIEIARSQVPSLNFGATTVAGTASSPQPVTLQNVGNQPLRVGVFSVGSPFTQIFNGNDNPADCTNGGNFNLLPAQSCTASITFNPPAGEFYSADVEFTDDSLNTDFAPFQQIALGGTGTGGVVNFSLSVSTAGTGSGSIGGTNCTTGSYSTGSTVICTENPGGGSQFTGWSGGTCSGTGSCSFTLTANSTVVANFSQSLSYALTVTEIGSGSGTVTSNDNSISCTSGSNNECSGSYPSGTPVTLTAAATGTSTFLGWGGACAASGTSATCNVTMNSALNVTASFVQQNFGDVNVCPSGQTTPAPCSKTLTLAYNLAANTTLGATQVVTQGAGGLDFSLASGGTCTGTITAGNSCTVNVNFAPLAPGLRRGAVSLYDNLGNLLATTPIYGVGQAPAIAFGPGTQTTLATTLPANGLNQPYGLAVDAAGDVFFGEPGANVVQKITPGGVQTTVGTFTGHPYGLAVDGAGDLFVADLNNDQIDKITPSGVQTVVPASGLKQPIGVAVDGAGNLFISDRNNNRVEKLTPGGVQTTLNITGLNQPYGLALDSAGDLFIADQNNNQVVEFTPGGAQSTVHTTGLNQPYGVAVDAAGDVFIVSFNDDRVIQVTPAGVQTTVAATGLSGPSGVALDAAGDVFISDYNNYRVVETQSSQLPSLSFPLTNVSSTSSPQSVSIQNVGNQPLTGPPGGPLVLSLGGNFTQNSSPDCSSLFPLAPGASCSETFTFTPQTTGYLTGTASFSDDTLNLSAAVVHQTVNLAGEGGLNGQAVGTAVPNVVGLTQAAATAAIANAGLTMGTVSTASSPIVSSGSVTASNPAAGTQVTPGSAVRLLISTGIAPPPTPNPLTFENNYFLTGDYAAAGVTLRGTGHSGIATGTINIPNSSTNPGSQGVPSGADIIDGFLYWETLENTAAPSGNNGTFLGFPISGQQVGSDQPFNDGTFNGTLRVYRADVNTYFPVATDGSGIRSGSGAFTVSLPDGGNALPITEGASLVVLYRVLSPNFPLKSVVIYDGSGIPTVSTSQNVLGFYDAVGGSSAAESTTLAYAPGGGWNNSFTSLSLPADATQYSMPLNSGNAYAAVIFSTPVKNSDNDGILDAWKAGPPAGDFYSGGPGYYDTKTGGWIPLPGAKHGQKDLFVQLDYMCGSVLPSGACDPNEENLFPSPDSNGNDPLAIVQNSFAANGVVLHLEIGNAVPEDTCTDNTSTTPAQLCQFPGEQGVIGWKNSLEFSKLWPRNFASCAAGGDCSTRFPFGQKDSYHYVLFGHSLAIPAWNTRYKTLTSISVASGVTTLVTTDRGTGINACPSRITIAGVLGNPTLNGVYASTSCPDTKTIVVATPGVPNWTYPNASPEPGIGLTSGTVTSISGYSDLGGADSAVTLGLWETAAGQDMSKRANVIAGTLFHEIGHTLGLTHGGLYYDSLPSYVPTFEANCKPNYQSSMNYLFQLDGVGPSAAVAFSNQTLSTIPDASLASVTQLTDLDQGLVGASATFPTSSWYTSTAPSATASPASLHCDGSPLAGDTGYRVNGNVDPISPAWTAGQNITFDGVSYNQLRGFNDAANIDLRQVGATGGELASLASVLSFGSSYSPLNVAAGGNVTLGAGGTVALGAGGTIALSAGGNATISSGSTITPAGGVVALNNGGSATLSTGGTITLGAGGNVTLGAGAAVRFGSAGTVSFGSGGGTVTLGAGGNVTLGAGGTISLVGGGNVTIPSTGGPFSYVIPPTGGTVTLGAGGTIALGAGGNVTLGAGGTIALGAGGNVTLGAGGNVTLGAGGTIALGGGGTIALGGGGNVTLGAGGTIALGAGGNVTMGAGGNVTLGAGGTVTLGAGGNVTLGAGGNVTLGAGGTVTLGAGGNVTLGAGGTITLGAGGNVTLGAGGTITSGGTAQSVPAGTYTVSAGGTVAMGAGGMVTLGAGGTVTLGAGGNVTLGAGGTVALGAGGNVTLGAGGTIALGAGGNVTLGAGGESTSELTYLTANSVVRPPSLPTETPMPSQNFVVVNWTAPAFGVVQTYTISRSSDGATPIVIGSVSGVGGNPPATTFTDTNPDFTSQTVVYTIGTTLLPVPIDPTPRQSPPSAPAILTNNQTIVLGSLQSSVSILTTPLTVTATAESSGAANGLQVNFSATGSCSIASQAPPDNNGVSSASVALNKTGTCTITASQPGTNLLQPGNPPYYNAATPVSGTFNIQTAGSTTQSQTILFPQLPTVRYGGNFSLSASSSVGLPITFAASGPCTPTGATTGVGLCAITASAQAGTVGSNTYSAASVTQSFTIQPAVLTVTATNVSGTYGESSLPTLTYTTSPLVNGDPSTAVTGAPVLSTTATTASSPGNYPITVSTGTLAAANYSFLYVSGTLIIQSGSQTALNLNTTSPLAYNQSELLSVTGGSSNAAVTYKVTTGPCTITGASLNQLTANSGTGSCSVTATMAGGGNYSPITSTPANVVALQPANQSALTLHTTSPLTYSQSEPLSVTGGSANGTVTYNVTAGSCAITGASLNQLTAKSGTGSCTVTATMAGNSNYNAVTSTPASVVNLQLASQAITFTTNAPLSGAFNSSFTVAATGGASGDPVTFTSSGSCSITGNTPNAATYTITSSTGTCSVIANQAGNANYSLAPTITETVNANGPAVTVSPSNISFGTVSQGSITTKTITVTNTGTAAVTINQPLLSIVKGGNSNEFVAVNFCPASLAVGKNCTITIAFVAGPFYTQQTATLEIMDNAPGSPQPVTLSALVLTPQTITFTINPPASAAYKSSFILAAAGGASGNAVTFTSSGVCTNLGATYTMTASSGTCSVIANQAGNSTYATATQVTKTVNATLAPQAITFTQAAPSSAAYKTSFAVSATGGASGNPVTFTSFGACTNSGATYKMTSGTGTCSVIANQAGNSNYAAATQVTKSVSATYSVATLGPATLSFGTVTNGRSSASQTATLSNTGTTPLVVSSIGFTGTNPGNFSETNNCPSSSSSLAAGKTCSISVTFNSGGKAATARLMVTDNTQAGTQSVSLSGN